MALDPSHLAYAGLLLLAPVWYPAIRSLVADIRAVALAPDATTRAEEDEATEARAPSDAPPAPALGSTPRATVGPLVNPLWSSGRRVGLARRVTPVGETSPPPRPRGFGRRPF